MRPLITRPAQNRLGVLTTPARTPGQEVALHPLAHGLAAPVGLEAIQVEPEPLGALPQVGILQPGGVGEQEVVHLPEAALAPGRLGRARGRPGARVAGLDREVAKHPAHVPSRQSRAVSAAQNGHSKSAYSMTSGRRAEPADVVELVGRREPARSRDPSSRGGLLEPVEDQVGARQLARRVGLVAPAHDGVGPDDGQRALGKAARVVGVKRPAGRRPWARSPRAGRCSRRASRETRSVSSRRRRRRRTAWRPRAVNSSSTCSYTDSWSVHTGEKANG